MNLRRQLLLVSLLTLVLPWAGCQFIRETETALREGQQNMLNGTAQAIADSLSQFPAEFLDAGTDGTYRSSQIYAHRLDSAPLIDGYLDDWNLDTSAVRSMRGVDGDIRYVFGRNDQHLYFVAEVPDDDIRYAEPSASDNVDRIELTSIDVRDQRVVYAFVPEARGPLVGRVSADGALRADGRLQGHWLPTADGYRLEARLPARMIGNYLGLDVWNAAAGRDRPIRSSSYADNQPGHLISVSPVLSSAIRPYAQTDLRLIVTDRAGWRLAAEGEISSSRRNPQSGGDGWMRLVYGAVLEPGNQTTFGELNPLGRETEDYVNAALRGEASGDWFRSQETGRAVVAIAQPVYSGSVQTGALILQQGTEAILSLTNTALGRLLGFTLIATIAAAAGLLGYASWLSLRIRRLSAAAERAADHDIETEALPSAAASDEIGDLSRSFSSVLKQLRDYNDYLRTLASKLSHELRTPLTIVSSSLENLEHEPLDEAAARYADRARTGTARLRKILDAMSEANRVEALMQNVEPETFNFTRAVKSAVSGYASAWPMRVFKFESDGPDITISGSPELIVQLLDKLVDNAVGFSSSGDEIIVRLASSESEAELSVYNPGPPLPKKMRGKLFDSMVSVRGSDADEHLGLGLHIARIVAEGHGGGINAESGDGGVTFAVRLPKDGLSLPG